MPRIVMMTADNATKALKLHHDAFSGSPCTACKGSCCLHCASAEGYLPSEGLSTMKKKYKYNKETGFKGPTGCNIPVHERSVTCVGFICSGYFGDGDDGRHLTKSYPRGGEEGPTWLFSDAQQKAADDLKRLLWSN